MNFETLAIRLQAERSQHREHAVPMFNTSSFVFDSAEQMQALFAGEEAGNIYSRFSNPNGREFEEKMCALEGCEDAHATASGMAAIFASLMAFLKSGDHLIASRALFGSTIGIIEQLLPEYGIEYTLVDPENLDSWEAAVRPNSRMLFLETPTNPGLIVVDLEKAGAFAQEHGLIFNVDNCFATPYLQTPSSYGRTWCAGRTLPAPIPCGRSSTLSRCSTLPVLCLTVQSRCRPCLPERKPEISTAVSVIPTDESLKRKCVPWRAAKMHMQRPQAWRLFLPA